MVVMPDRSGEREEALEHPGTDALLGVAAVMLQAEFGFQCLVDRLDDLTQRTQLGLPAAGFLLAVRGSTSSMP